PALLRPGHRHRRPAGEARSALPGLFAGGQLDDAEVRRHGARPGDLGTAGQGEGGPRVGGGQAGPGQHGLLPGRVRAVGGARRRAAVAVAGARGLPVLVVDDNATNRRILNDMLTAWGMAPMLVESGREALAAMNRAAGAGEPFPLVLLDNMMPEMDGFMLAEEI